MIRSKITSLSNEYHFYFIGFFFAGLGILSPIFYLLLVAYSVFIFKKVLKRIYFILIAVIIGLTLLVKYSEPVDYINGDALVVSVSNTYSKMEVEVLYNFKIYKLYTKEQYKTGDIVGLSGEVSKFRKQTMKNGFDAYLFNKGNNTYGTIEVEHLERKTFVFNFKYLLETHLSGYTNNTKIYLEAFLLGEKKFSDGFNEIVNAMGLFSIIGLSGMFIYQIKKLLKKGMFYLDLKPKTQDKIMLIFDCLFFLTLLNSFLAIRIFLYSLLKFINSKYHLELTSLDILSITIVIVFILCPYYFYNQGVFLSVVILFSIKLYNATSRKANYLIDSMKVNSLIYLVSLPFLINFTNNLNLLATLFVVVIMFVSNHLLLPLVVMSLLVPFVSPLCEYVLGAFEQFISILSGVNVLKFSVPNINIIVLLLHYLFFILVILVNNKYKKIFLAFGGIVILMVLVNVSHRRVNQITFLDVNQGNSAIIEYDKKVIVVDAYANSYNYLVKNNIMVVDYLILTHSDEDHIKDAGKIIERLKVKELIINPFDEYGLYHENTKRCKAYDQIRSEGMQMDFFAPLKKYDKTNNNSLVFKLKLAELTILFPGDVMREAEEDILNEFGDNLESSIMLSPHHGSKTSNNEQFIRTINPKVVIISVGINNRYNLPNIEVTKRFNEFGIEVFRTDKHGSIVCDFNKKGYQFYLPY